MARLCPQHCTSHYSHTLRQSQPHQLPAWSSEQQSSRCLLDKVTVNLLLLVFVEPDRKGLHFSHLFRKSQLCAVSLCWRRLLVVAGYHRSTGSLCHSFLLSKCHRGPLSHVLVMEELAESVVWVFPF